MGNYHALLAKSPALFAEQAGLVMAGGIPPQDVLDHEAEMRLTGGYTVKDDNLCLGCFTYRSDNGDCWCI